MQERKKTISLGVLFWIAAILLVLVVFLFNRKNIEQVMESTGFIEIINQRIGINKPSADDGNRATESLLSPDRELPPDNGAQLPLESGTESEPSPEVAPATKPAADPADPSADPVEVPASPAAPAQSTPAATPTSTETPAPAETPASTSTSTSTQKAEGKNRDYLIHLVQITDDGNISLEAITRSVRFVSSPLTETLRSLIEEPTENGNYRNLIPSNTILNRVWIDGGIAYIDVSEEFRFNPIGMEGYKLQVQQIIATATQFASVQSVQILIDGEQVNFLGGDGLFIGQPLQASDL